MRDHARNSILYPILALLIGLGLGLAYSWLISPVTYVDASPELLREDFKDQYRLVIAAAYASNHDLARARARLGLLQDEDMIGSLSAQAQRMLAAGEKFETVQQLANLAGDLTQGVASISSTNTPDAAKTSAPPAETPFIPEAPLGTSNSGTSTPEESGFPTPALNQTAFAPFAFTVTPRPTSTPMPLDGKPFALIAQDEVCDVNIPEGLMQFLLLDSRRRQIPAVEITVVWAGGEDRFFTGLKPDLGAGQADFKMEAGVSYSARIAQGGAFVANLSAPSCIDSNGTSYLGGLLLTFQQP